MKKPNKIYSGIFLIFCLTLLPLFYLPYINITYLPTISDNSYLKISSDDGVSNYSIAQSITYEVAINFTLDQLILTGSYFFKFPRLNDRDLDSPLTEYCPPFQDSELLYLSKSGAGTDPWYYIDEFNNSYDIFNASVMTAASPPINFHCLYNITLNEVAFGDIQKLDIDMSDYDVYDPMFNFYCNNSEQYYETNNTALIAKSNEIVGSSTNPMEIAQKISSWVSSYLTYDNTGPAQEIGALAAYNTGKGDCSEFSTLMITLLRIQGIPARKVTGYLAYDPTTTSTFRPPVGYSQSFTYDGVTSDLLGHAWVEYYIPTIGWISCEPQVPSLYKTSSYSRFTHNIGAWFLFPKNATHYYNDSEFNRIIGGTYSGSNNINYTFSYTVVAVNLIPEFDLLAFLIPIVIIVGVIALVGLVIYIIIKKT